SVALLPGGVGGAGVGRHVQTHGIGVAPGAGAGLDAHTVQRRHVREADVVASSDGQVRAAGASPGLRNDAVGGEKRDRVVVQVRVDSAVRFLDDAHSTGVVVEARDHVVLDRGIDRGGVEVLNIDRVESVRGAGA